LTSTVTKIDVEERRARLGVRHHLARRGESVEQVSSDLVGLHSSDPIPHAAREGDDRADEGGVEEEAPSREEFTIA